MLSMHIDNINDLAVVECEGGIVGSEAAFRLREAVTSQTEWCTHCIEPATVRMPEGVRSQVPDSSFLGGPIKFPPHSRVRIGKSSDFDWAGKHPIIRPQELGNPKSIEEIRQRIIPWPKGPSLRSALDPA